MMWFVSTLGVVGRLTKRVPVVGVKKHATPWYAAISSTVGWQPSHLLGAPRQGVVHSAPVPVPLDDKLWPREGPG